MTGQTDLEHIKFERAMVLGTDMPRGEYILQTMVTDDRAKPNEQLASQFVQFEVVD